VLFALAALTGDTARVNNKTSNDAVIQEEKCVKRLNRFKEIDVTAESILKGHALTKDPDFPAAESSIAATGESCGDSAQQIDNLCSKYDNWVDMKTASKAMWGAEVFNVFNAVTDQPAHADVQQGEMGTCYFLAAILSIAHTRPEIIKSMFVRTELWAKDIVTTKWLIGGMETLVEVDTTIPFSKSLTTPWFTTPTEETKAWWPSILEKTWSKIFTSYKAAEGGFFMIPLGAITRAPTVSVLTKSFYDVAAGKQDEEKKAEHWDLLKSATANQWPMGCTTASRGTPLGAANGHQYSILEAIEDEQAYGRYGSMVVKVMNPWNKGYYNGAMKELSPDMEKTGVFLMTYDEFLQICTETTIAKVHANYQVTSSELTSAKSLQDSYKFTVTQDKPFYVSVTWPSDRMMQPCTALKPQVVVSVDGGIHDAYHDGPSNAAYVSVTGGQGSYRVAVSIKFPEKHYITSAYMNIYAAESVDLYAADTAYPKLSLGMLSGGNVGGNPCSTVTFAGSYWTPNYNLMVGGVATYSQPGEVKGNYMAYWYAPNSEWFLIPSNVWQADGSKYGTSYGTVDADGEPVGVAKTDMKCGCKDAVGDVPGWKEITCAEVNPPKFSNVACGVGSVDLHCPLACGVEACKVALPNPLPRTAAPAPAGSNGLGPSPAKVALPNPLPRTAAPAPAGSNGLGPSPATPKRKFWKRR